MLVVVVVGGATGADTAVVSVVVEAGAAGIDLGKEAGLVGFFCVTWGRRMGWKRKAEDGGQHYEIS